jgi:Alkylmercury lyase
MNPLTAEAVHTYLIQQLLSTGSIQTRDRVASQLEVTTCEIEDAYRRLAEGHGLVLHPNVLEPSVIHPFSLVPTPHWIESDTMGWWSPCIWCALGIAALADGEVRINTRLGAEREVLSITVRDGMVTSDEPLFAHFAIPPKRAWDNVMTVGVAVPLKQAALLAKEWYGGYAEENWHKWSKSEAQAIFCRVGLNSSFWDIGSDVGGF